MLWKTQNIQQKKNPSRITSIDFIRNIACFNVIMLHSSMPFFFNNNVYQTGFSSVLSQIIYYLGTAAVPLFFMTNGFFLINRAQISYKYIFSKIALILVPVLAWNFLICILKFIIKHRINFFQDVGNSLIQKGFFFQFQFLGALMIILLFAPILNYIMKKSVNIVLIILALLLIFSWAIDVYNHISGKAPIQSHIIQTFRLWTWASYYIAGGLFGHYFKKINWQYFKKRLSILLLFLTILVIVFSISNHQWTLNPFAEYNYDNILVFIWIMIIFAKLSFYSKFQLFFQNDY